MKNKLGMVLFGIAACLFWSSVALGAEQMYAGVQAGAVFLEDADTEGIDIEFDTGFGILGALGYDMGQLRLEGEFGYRENDVDRIEIFEVDGEASAVSLMVNGFVDFETQGTVTPFVGAGIGIANIEVELEGDDEDDTVFAYQLAAGLGLALTEVTTLDLSYRFFATSDPEFSGIESEYHSHNAMVGLRLAF